MTEWILRRVAWRVGSLDGKRFFYTIARTHHVGWPKRQGWWMLAFLPLCRYHNEKIMGKPRTDSLLELLTVLFIIGFTLGVTWTAFSSGSQFPSVWDWLFGSDG